MTGVVSPDKDSYEDTSLGKNQTLLNVSNRVVAKPDKKEIMATV